MKTLRNLIRKYVKKRSRGVCEDCGKIINVKKSTAGHLNHTRNEHYNDAANLVNRCVYCEIVYHLKYAENPNTIGLSKKANDRTIYGHLCTLDEKELSLLSQDYIDSLILVFKRLKIDELKESSYL